MGYFSFLNARSKKSQFTPGSRDYSAEKIQDYFRAHRYAQHGHDARHEMMARARMRIEQAARAQWESSASNMTFGTGGDLSSMTPGSASTGGTVYTGTVASNRQAVRARRILRGVRASSTRPTAMKAAMFLPGKGAEVDLIANNYLQPIIHKIPWKNEKLRYDGISSGLENPRGNRLSMDFALKMIIECQKAGMTVGSTGSTADIIPTRFHCAHIFRHTNNNAFQSGAGPTATNTEAWNNTLGPDASYVRLTPAEGGSMLTSGHPGGFVNSLLSPYRNPNAGSNMYARVGLQILENIGWNMNPMKFIGGLGATSSTGGGFAGVTVYENAPLSTPTSTVSVSVPHSQMSGSDAFTSNNKYITQHGPGGVSYAFSNDGTNAVTLECVIIAFTKAANPATSDQGGISDPYLTFVTAAQKAFTNRQEAKQGSQQLAGDPHTAVSSTASSNAGAIFSNAETEFIPNNIWPYMGRNTTGDGATTTSVNPFKFVSRDQFVIGGGQTRLWKTTFPTDVYDASVESPQDAPNVNSHSIMVIWGLCSAPLPCIESSGTTSNKIMLSREPQNCNVSCLGTYHETPTPVFCKKNPAPVNLIGSLSQVSVLPAGGAFPTGSPPQVAGTIPTSSAALVKYVDLPRSGQQPFLEPQSTTGGTQVASTLEIGTLSTLG